MAKKNCTLKIVATFFLLVSFASPNVSNAAEGSLTDEYDKCLKKYVDNAGWAGCGQDEIKRQESLLADAWKKASEDIKELASRNSMCEGCGERAIESLKQAQEDWKKSQDSACEYLISGLFAREDEVLAYPRCKAEVISDRVAALRQISKAIKEIFSH